MLSGHFGTIEHDQRRRHLTLNVLANDVLNGIAPIHKYLEGKRICFQNG